MEPPVERVHREGPTRIRLAVSYIMGLAKGRKERAPGSKSHRGNGDNTALL